ncbi:MAG: SAM-dependent chlorinase/fluorinase [Planctomycetes bacterium]|nr:SAM-dependent chlorinase/fluorinase [Planctomycetota bacterium]
MTPFTLHKDRTPACIALLTDFGFKDSYVGVMKGVIQGICADASIVDLSHNVLPQDVAEAAFVLSASYRYFPAGTIFVCVVDPGVGSDRAVLLMRANQQVFLAPDNGLLSVIADECGHDELRHVTSKDYVLHNASSTFHGRDVFAPVAAHLAAGLDPAQLGPAARNMRRLQLPRPVRTADGSLRGEIIYIDQFGNLITNIREATVRRSFKAPLEGLELRVKRRKVKGIANTYAERPAGELVALIGSSAYLEVAVNQGSAAEMLGCERGDTVNLTTSSQ